MVTVVNSVGSRLRVFSKVSETSAMPLPARVRDPLKIRSSRLSERRALILCSPITQRMASTMFDLPQPFGPTIPVIGWSSTTWVLSAKDLNPFISSDFKRKGQRFWGRTKIGFSVVYYMCPLRQDFAAKNNALHSLCRYKFLAM